MDQLERVARSEVGALLRDLPPEIRREAVCIPVSYESYPSEKLNPDGVLTNTLGLLVGGNRNEEEGGLITVPVQIILFLGNLCDCLLYTSPSPRDVEESRMPSSA